MHKNKLFNRILPGKFVEQNDVHQYSHKNKFLLNYKYNTLALFIFCPFTTAEKHTKKICE